MRAKPFTQYGVKAWMWLFWAYWLLWPVLLRLRWSGFDWLKRHVEFRREALASNPNPIEPLNDAKPAAMHEIVRLAARLHLLRADCLPKSIVLVTCLQRQGYHARTVIGVHKDGDTLASHAWVDVFHDGCWQMVGEPQSVAGQFTRI